MQLFDTLTPRWGLFLMGCIGLLLAPIPFIAFYFGPRIRERSPYSKILMAEERKRVEAELLLERKTDEEMARVITGQSVRRAVSRGMSRVLSGGDDTIAEEKVLQAGRSGQFALTTHS